MGGDPVTAGLLAPLTRPELDELLKLSEIGYTRSHTALACAPLDEARIVAACGVAQECLCLWHMALDESIARMVAGEAPR
jgi:hypothetical protein